MKTKFAPIILGASLLAPSFAPTLMAATTNIVQDMQVSSVVRPAWLREYLPDNTLFYARIPSLWSSVSYKEDSFKYALGNKSYTDTVQTIQEASAKWVDQADQQLKPLLSLLVGQLDGPIEIAAIAGGMMPQVLVSANLNIEDSTQLQALIDSLIEAKVVKSEVKKMVDGAGQLMTDVGPTPYRWDSEKKRLDILLNFGGADLKALNLAYSSLSKNLDSPMLANEAQLESSHQGLYLWYNNEKTYPMYKAMIPPNVQQQMNMFGVPDMKSLALSWGVRNEKGRIKLLLEAPTTGMIRSLLPTNANDLNIATAGEAKFTALLALPSTEQFTKIEQMLMQMSPNSKKYQEFKALMLKNMGFSVEDILNAVGPELTTIFDEAGEYLAVRIRDEVKFATILEKLTAQEGVTLIEKEVEGKQVSYMKIPSLFESLDSKEMKDVPFFIKDMMTKVSTHLYWQKEGDYLILADLPQVLLDRQMMLKDNNLNTWLADKQKQDLSASTLALSGTLREAPRRLYYTYLNALQLLADLTGAEIDTFSLPSARQLSLADKGTLGLQFDSSEKNIGLELTFESTPADVLLSGQGMATLAGIGMASAIAIPAYKDYQFKATAMGATFSVDGLKGQVAETYAAQGRYPNQQEIDAYVMPKTRDYKVIVEEASGKIIISFRAKHSKRLEFTPEASVNNIKWSCATNLSRSSRPSNCTRSIRK
jgi:Tfp pilus assembly major pilin PilA